MLGARDVQADAAEEAVFTGSREGEVEDAAGRVLRGGDVALEVRARAGLVEDVVGLVADDLRVRVEKLRVAPVVEAQLAEHEARGGERHGEGHGRRSLLQRDASGQPA